MNADEYYTDIAKENFYLGIISQVFRGNSYVQVENLSLLRDRKIHNEILIPGTINYFVVIEDTQGLFIGEVFQSKVQDTDVVNQAINKGQIDHVFPEIGIDIIGYMSAEHYFKLPGFRTVGINDKVYIANTKIVRAYQNSLETLNKVKSNDQKIQKPIKNLASFANFPGMMFSVKPNTLFDRHLLVIGSTNSGKSTSALSIMDKLINNKIKLLIIDPTGEYHDSFPEINGEQHLVLGENAFLPVGDVTMSQWELLFQTNDNTQGAVLSDAIRSLRFNYKENNKNEVYYKSGKKVTEVERDLSSISNDDTTFNLLKLPEQIVEESVELNTQKYHTDEYIFRNFRANANAWLEQKIQHQFQYSSLTKFFTEGSENSKLLRKIDCFCDQDDTSLYIDASKIGLSDGIGTMIIDLLSNYIINKSTKKLKPFVLFIDEVHRYTQFQNELTGSFSGLINIAREGRKKGIFLFLTTQSPCDVPKILLSQIGTLLIHRLTSIEDLQLIRNHLDEHSQKQIINLNQGEALLTSINLLKDVQLDFAKSDRTHYNQTPLL